MAEHTLQVLGERVVGFIRHALVSLHQEISSSPLMPKVVDNFGQWLTLSSTPALHSVDLSVFDGPCQEILADDALDRNLRGRIQDGAMPFCLYSLAAVFLSDADAQAVAEDPQTEEAFALASMNVTLFNEVVSFHREKDLNDRGHEISLLANLIESGGKSPHEAVRTFVGLLNANSERFNALDPSPLLRRFAAAMVNGCEAWSLECKRYESPPTHWLECTQPKPTRAVFRDPSGVLRDARTTAALPRSAL